jgi:hypothetical protein
MNIAVALAHAAELVLEGGPLPEWVKFYSRDADGMYNDGHDTAEDAAGDAEAWIDGACDDFWHESTDNIAWGVSVDIEQATQTDRHDRPEPTGNEAVDAAMWPHCSEYDYWCNYTLLPRDHGHCRLMACLLGLPAADEVQEECREAFTTDTTVPRDCDGNGWYRCRECARHTGADVCGHFAPHAKCDP